MSNNGSSDDSTTDLDGRLVLGRYRIVRPLARGGMGVVYLGRVEGDAGFSKPVVVKSVLPNSSAERDSEQLFAREARIVANLQHPGIVAVVDFGKFGPALVMVLEYVHGYHLGQWLRFVNETRGSVPVPLACHVVLCVLDALSYAHNLTRPDGTGLGIVHRDVSPANVLIDLQGHVKLSDFGIARMADDEFKTQEGIFRGTLAYCAPESILGFTPSPQMDQYSAAAVLYHLLAGKNPFIGTSPKETLNRVLSNAPALIATVRDDVPGEIVTAVARALSKNPEARFASVEDFARAIRSGCSWSEHEVAEDFAAQIAHDFSGDGIAKQLNLEPLTQRDAAWRDVQSTDRRIPLSSSPPRLRSESKLAPAPSPASEYDTSREAPISKVKQDARGRPTTWFVFAALAAGAGAAAVIALLPHAQGDHTPRVLVIEKEKATPDESASPTAQASQAPAPQASQAPTAPASSSRSTVPQGHPTATASANRGAQLARAFQKQETKIQGCFRQYEGSVEGDPQVSVRFRVDASGVVQNAAVSPSSIANTPLGACITTIARATNFGPQPEPLSFAIPIAARFVHR